MKKERELSIREAGMKGGNNTLKRHGKKHFKKISEMGLAARLAKKPVEPVKS